MEKQSLSESDLLKSIRARENRAFAFLQRKCYDVVKMMVVDNFGQIEDAEDIYEEGIVDLIKIIDRSTLELTCKVSTLFITICKNKWMSILENRKAATNYHQKHKDYTHVEDIYEKLDKDIYMGVLWESFELLKDDCKNILRAYFMELSVNNIAEIFGYSPGYVKKKKHYCHKALILLILEEWVGTPISFL